MLTRVRIRNFRAIDDLEIRLSPFQIIIGENNAGKTSFLEALLGLRRMTEQPVIQAWKGWQNAFERNRRVGAGDTAISWDLSTDRDEHYQVSVGMAPLRGLAILEEKLEIDGRVEYELTTGPDGRFTVAPGVHGSSGAKLLVSQNRDREACASLDRVLRGIKGFRLHPEAMWEPVDAATSLESNGYGFPAFLDRIQNLEPETFERIQEMVREIFEIRFVRTPAADRRNSGEDGNIGQAAPSDLRELAVLEPGSLELVHGPQLADGIVLLLGYLAIALSSLDRPSVLLVDEPELGLHTRRTDFLVTLFRELSRGELGPPVQIIMTTHSPDVVDLVRLDELIIFKRRRNGTVAARRAGDIPDLRDRMRGFNPGEFWALYGEDGFLGEDEA